MEACVYDARVVDDHQAAFGQEVGYLVEAALFDGLSGAIYQEFGLVAPG